MFHLPLNSHHHFIKSIFPGDVKVTIRLILTLPNTTVWDRRYYRNLPTLLIDVRSLWFNPRGTHSALSLGWISRSVKQLIILFRFLHFKTILVLTFKKTWHCKTITMFELGSEVSVNIRSHSTHFSVVGIVQFYILPGPALLQGRIRSPKTLCMYVYMYRFSLPACCWSC